MTTLPRIQFSLKFFLIACVILGICLAFVLSSLQSHRRLQNSISGVFNNSGSSSDYAYEFKGYLNHRDEPVVFLLWVVDEEDPKMSVQYGYTSGIGGVLVIDGQQVVPSKSSWLFVSGPYGHTMKLELSDAETTALMKIRSVASPQILAQELWRELVEARIYETEGKLVGGKREGHWIFRLRNGAKYREGSYRQDKRDGPWTIYYPTGNVRSRIEYTNGRPTGTWTYYDNQGQTLVSTPTAQGAYRPRPDAGAFSVGGNIIPTPELPADLPREFPIK